MFFHSFTELGRVVLVSALIFGVVVTILRFVGQEALAKMSGYDVVATIMIGDIIGNVAADQMPLVEGTAAVATVIALQQIIRWAQSRYLAAHHAVREPPRVVLWDGQLLEDRLKKNRISGDEVRAAVRKEGFTSLSQVRGVVLENDGDWSIIEKSEEPSDDSALLGLPIRGRADNTMVEHGGQATPAPADRMP